VAAGRYRGGIQQELVSSYASMASSPVGLAISTPTHRLTLHSMISYPNYKFIFPIKALGMFARRFGDSKMED
jgi:hypothetical protein